MTPTTRIRIVWAFLAIVVIVAGLVAATPSLINTRLVKNQIASQISGWMGLPVSVHGEPVITVFPYLTVKLRDLTVASHLGADEPPLVAMDTLRVEMYWLPLLVGKFEARRFNLINPIFELTRRADGSHSWDMSAGSLFAMDGEQTGLNLSNINLGHFRISNGTAHYQDVQAGSEETISAVDMSIVWPKMGRSASIGGTLDWRGETAAFEASSDKPMELIAGGLSPISLSVDSNRLTARLDGSAGTMAKLQLEGDFAFKTPSMKGLLDWLGIDSTLARLFGPASLEARANLAGGSVSFTDMALNLDDNRADGVLQFDFRRARPLVQGTLAYDKLDLTPYLGQLKSGDPLLARRLSPDDFGLVDLDIRLSAAEVQAAPLRLDRMAASLVTRDNQLSLSIGEAYGYGGRIEANLDMRPSKNSTSNMDAHLRTKANGLMAGQLARQYAQIPFLTGTALIEADIEGNGASLAQMIETAHGDLSVVLTVGSISPFSLDIMQDVLEIGEEAEPDALYEGETPFDVLSVRGKLDEKKLMVEGLRMTSGNRALEGAARLDLDTMELDFPGILMLYGTSDTALQSNQKPKALHRFHLFGQMPQPLLEAADATDPARDKDISVPGVPDAGPDKMLPSLPSETAEPAQPKDAVDANPSPATLSPASGTQGDKIDGSAIIRPNKDASDKDASDTGASGPEASDKDALNKDAAPVVKANPSGQDGSSMQKPDLGEAAQKALQIPFSGTDNGLGLSGQ